MKAERGDKAEEEKSESSSDLWLGIKERHCLYNIKLPGEAASADIEGTTNDPECQAPVINDSGYNKQQILNVEEMPYIGRRCHLGLSWLQQK